MNRQFAIVLGVSLRSLAFAMALIFLFATSARAQHEISSIPQFEVSADYSFIRARAADSQGSFNLNGGSASFAYNFNDRFSLVADAGAYHFRDLPPAISSNMFTYLVGPRIRFRHYSRLTPFAHALLGGARLNASSGSISGGENGFSMALGGGVDMHFRSHLALRLIQAEYLMTRFDRVDGSSATQNNIRISAGLVFRFGLK